MIRGAPRVRVAASLAVAVLLLMARCAAERSEASEREGSRGIVTLGDPRELGGPAGEGARSVRISSDGSKRLFLSWLMPGVDKSHALQIASFEKGSWSKPMTVIEGKDLFANWADTPALLASPAGGIFVSWLRSTGHHTYDVVMSTSRDGGRSWSKPVTPHRDGNRAEHGFVSMVPATNGGADVVWLDGRNWKEGEEGSAPMTLQFANMGADGSVSPEREIDPMVCDCCPTSMAVGPRGSMAVYRDRTAAEVRDISLVTFRAGKASPPRSVGSDGWKIAGCPVNGPRIATHGNRVGVAWFTGAGEKGIVKLAVSIDGGERFGTPVILSEKSIGRVDLAMFADGSCLVTWQDVGSEVTEVLAAQVRDGRVVKRLKIGQTGKTRSGAPHSAFLGPQLFIAWPDTSSKVPVVRVSRIEWKQGQ